MIEWSVGDTIFTVIALLFVGFLYLTSLAWDSVCDDIDECQHNNC